MAALTTTPDDFASRPSPEVDVIGDRQHLAGLMVEIRNLLRADTAVLLLLDATGRQLEPVISVGLGRAYRAAMRVPIGRGFAGLVATRRSNVMITDLATADIVNPVLRGSGLRSLLGAPLIVADELVGVVHVGSMLERTFTEEDDSLLTRSAERLARAIQDRRTAEEHTAALILQRSLLPGVLPQIPGIDFAARYLPADGDFGGDWYDVFTLPGGQVGVVMGDVAGHGLASSVIMGRLRSALRAYSLDYDDPAEVLTHLDRKLTHFERGAMATVLYIVIPPPFDKMIISSAGHLAPVVANPRSAGPRRQLEIAVDPPLGVTSAWARRATVIPLSAGDIVCAFTDGLVERRPGTDLFPDIDSNIYAVADALEEDTAEANCSHVLARVLPDDADDDIALLVMRRT
jgi:sigma-B regulation protein RsbU (phosphoserine phosphatase)